MAKDEKTESEDNMDTAPDATPEEKSLSKEAVKARKAAEKVTEYIQEKESKDAMTAVRVVNSLAKFEPKDGELFAGDLRPEDVHVLVDELELNKEQSELLLRKSGGDFKLALAAFLQ